MVVYKNGNITELYRKGLVHDNNTMDVIDDLDYQYMPYSNRLATVNDFSDRDEGFKDNVPNFGDPTADDYVYDSNGNMISDQNKEISLITYNHLNLPERIEMTQGVIEYFYDATGVKQQKRVAEGSNVTETFYAGQFVYKRTDVTTPLQDFEFYFTPEGYAKKENGILSYVYQYKDHLGNIRLSYQKDGNGNAEIIEENNYYPFGLKHQGYNIVVNGSDHPYGFGGKEEQNELGLDWIDVTARNYDPAIGRWMNIDPKAHLREWLSPYNFVQNNPINRIDPDGALDDWYISNEEGATDEPIWLPNDADATNVYGENGFINLGENLLDEVVITPDGASAGKSYDVPSFVINAKGEYGQKDSEHPDQKEQNPRVLEYHATTQNPDTGEPYTDDEIAWCASFTNWNITQVGLPSNENKYNATATGYNKWNTQYTQLDKPAVGALAVINNSHVTFVIGMNGKNIHGFGGNQSNQVKVSTFFSPSSVKYYLPVGVTPNYNVPTIKYNFSKVKNESTR